MKLVFSRQIFYNTQMSKFMNVRPMGAELLHAEGRTDEQDRQAHRHDEANRRFS